MTWAGIGRFGGIGDNLICSSVLPGLKQRWGRIDVITQKPQGVVFENNPYIDKVTYRSLETLPKDGIAYHEWFASKATEYDFFVNLSTTCEGRLAFLRFQTEFYWPVKVRRQIADKSYLELVHDICDLPYEFAPSFYPTDAEVESAAASKAKVAPDGRKVIGWCLGGTRIDKVWPYNAMAVTRLIRETGCPVILFGQPGKDLEIAKIILAHHQKESSTHAGLHLALSPVPFESPEKDWPIRRGLSLIQMCDLVIGPDTGPLWAVSMMDMPKIVMLSHASPTNITKHWRNTVSLHADPARVPCWPCHRLHDTPDTCVPKEDGGITAASCMMDISVETMVRTAKCLLQ